MNEPVFLSRTEVDTIHAESLRQHGGVEGCGIRDWSIQRWLPR